MLIYILSLTDGHFYVGRAKDGEAFEQRFTQHLVGEGSEWTKLHPVLGIHLIVTNPRPAEEDEQVLSLMREHGIDKVRGGSFCSPRLQEHEHTFLSKMIDSVKGSCYQCHEKGHCTNECPLSLSMAARHGGDWICPDCGNNVFGSKRECGECGKWRPKSAAPSPVVAGRKPGDWDCPKCGDHQFSKNATCRQCGTPKPTPGEKRQMLDPPAAEPEAKRARAEAPSVVVKPGDWPCPTCGVNNFASRKACFKCKAIKRTPETHTEDGVLCAICMVNPVKVMVSPCNHVCLCEKCAPMVEKTCPLCRTDIEGKDTVFL